MIMKNHPLGNKLEDFKILEKIGSGGFASVYRAKSKQPGYEDHKCVAIKMIDKKYIKKKNLKRLVDSEISIHSNLWHPAIVKFHTWFADEKCIYLVLELCDHGSLDEYLRNSGPLSEKNACQVIKQIIDAVMFLHAESILHRDLSLKNILLMNNKNYMQIKIADFGMATQLTHANEKKNTMVGTANYMSPEVVQKWGYDTKADCWSVGCILYALLYGEPPFDGKEKNYMQIMNNAVMSKLQFPSNASPEARELLEAMLMKDPKRRIDISESLNYPFFLKNEFGKELELNPLKSRDSGLDSPTSSRSVHKNYDSGDGAPNSYSNSMKETRNRCGHNVLSSLETVHDSKPSGCHPCGYNSLSGHQKEQESSSPGRQGARISRNANNNCSSSINKLKNKIPALPPLHESNECVLSRPMCSNSREHYPAIDDQRWENRNQYQNRASMQQNFYSINGLESQIGDVHIRSRSESPLPYPSRLQNIRTVDPLCSESCYSGHNSLKSSIHSGNGYVYNEMSYKNSKEDIPKTSCSHERYCAVDVICSHEMVCCCHQYLEAPPTDNRSDHHQPYWNCEEKNSPCIDIILEKSTSTERKGLKGVVEPLTTERLEPTRHTVKNFIASILNDGQVCLEFLKVRRNKKCVCHVCFISGDGWTIRLYKPKKNIVVSDEPPPLPKNHCEVKYFNFENLPEAYWKKYRHAKSFVDIVRTKTPKVTLYGEKAKCMMMENSPDPDYQVHFYDGCLIIHTVNQTTFTDQNGISRSLVYGGKQSTDIQLKWDVYIMMKERCQRTEAYWKKSPDCCFPITLNRKPSSQLLAADANKENTRSLYSSALNGAVNAMKSYDLTMSTNSSPSQNSLPRNTPSPLQMGRNTASSFKTIAEIVLDLKDMPRVENKKVMAEYKDGIQMWSSRDGQEVYFYDTKNRKRLTNIQQDSKNMKRIQNDLAGILVYVMSEEARTK